jgi:hypoxanthine phosphoribosyltransferase
LLCYNPAAVTDSAQPPTSPPLSSPAPAFAHAAEAEFARLLDFYGLRWEYEPRTFVLRQDKAGQPAAAFTPDFYLPDQDLYVEITTIKPRQVRRKNRKIRWLLEHHPDINIKLFKRSDFRQLMAKYGLDDDDRSAWLGQDSQTDSDENDDLSHHRHL